MDVWPLICPVREEPLHRAGDTLRCPRAHVFDVTREGYVNLLLSTGRRRRALGDGREMLQARRRFLERGHYQLLSDAVNRSCAKHPQSDPPMGGLA